MFRYYRLVGNTAVPIGLYARLCHAFLVLFYFIIERIAGEIGNTFEPFDL